ncbi:MAG: hypothetical protein EPN85_01385 [Bacteroidetes bacterium]|nr:MAG: hypothetical protein EPN85_01385 [Bacteroidota bacterium]
MANFLLKKSDENEQAAVLLEGKTWFAPSVHCSYYSCIQALIYLLMEKRDKKINSAELKSEFDEWKRSPFNRKGGSHVFYIQTVKYLLKKNGKEDKVKDYNKIFSLQGYREKSDYMPEDITPTECTEAKKIRDNFVRDIKNVFGI